MGNFNQRINRLERMIGSECTACTGTLRVVLIHSPIEQENFEHEMDQRRSTCTCKAPSSRIKRIILHDEGYTRAVDRSGLVNA
jgi:heterodisulfide reductase subunit A-like polyferredoxin